MPQDNDSRYIFEAYSDHSNQGFPTDDRYKSEFREALDAILRDKGFEVDQNFKGHGLAIKGGMDHGEEGAECEYYFDDNGHFHINAMSYMSGREYKEDKGPVTTSDVADEKGMDATLAAEWIEDAINVVWPTDDESSEHKQWADEAEEEARREAEAMRTDYEPREPHF